MIVIALGPIKCAELAIHVTDIRIIDIAIGDISNDLATASAVMFFFREIAPHACQRAELLERYRVKLKRFLRRNAFALENFVAQCVSIQ